MLSPPQVLQLALSFESPHSPPQALLPREAFSVGPPQSPLSCHLLLAARAQIGSQDLIHLI